MPRIAAVATAVPPHAVAQHLARDFAIAHFRNHRPDVERLAGVFNHAGIEQRYLCVPPDWFLTPRTFAEKNNLYIEWCTRLGAEVTRRCIEQSGIPSERITQMIFVSTTGLATPSIDSRLMNVLGLPPHVVRTPVWGLGCAGGAAGLALAHRLARSEPQAAVMLVAVELCGLTFHFEDFSKSNFIATALFGDGAAGVLVTGDDLPLPSTSVAGPKIIDTQTTTWPGSLDVMGWSFDSVGMQVIFSQAIPQIVRAKVRANMEEFLERHRLTFDKVPHIIAHPGGAKVLDAYASTLPLQNGCLDYARAILRDYGNMSSPTVLFVLEKFLASGAAHPGDYGILTALGPGFSAENILLQF